MMQPFMLRTLVLLLSLSWSGSALAADLVSKINIRVIYATKAKAQSVDPLLTDIQSELEALPYTKFRQLDKLESDVPINASVELQFPGERSISVRFLGLDVSGNKPMLSLQLKLKPRLNMQLRLADGGRTLLGGPKHLDGTLILDVTAKLKPAHEKTQGDKEKEASRLLEVNR